MKPVIAAVLAASLFISSCGGRTSARSDAEKAAAALTGDDRQDAADNPQCKLFTRAEIAKYIGEPVTAGRNAAGGCQWVTTKTRSDGSQGNVMVVVVPARYHERPALANGFRNVADVGQQGFVAEDLGGWVAGTVAGTDAVRVSLDGAAASAPNAIALLKEAVARRAR
jgi:hypothetical protein